MPSDSGEAKRGRLMLYADGALITAGAFALMMGAAFGLDALGVSPLGDPAATGASAAFSWLSWLLQVGAFVVGPALTWTLHGRAFGKGTLLGAVIAFPVASGVVMTAAMLGAATDWAVGLFTTAQFASAIAYLVLRVTAFVALTAWLDADAVRDLAHSPRQHPAVDAARLGSTLAIGAFVWFVSVALLKGEGSEAGVFMLVAAVQGAVVVISADIVTRVLRTRNGGQAAAGGV